MPNIEELEQRKKELELRRDIRRLERNERVAQKLSQVTDEAKDVSSKVALNVVHRSTQTAKWNWLWVGPLALLGTYLVLGGLVDGPIMVAGVGTLLLVPAWFKISGRK